MRFILTMLLLCAGSAFGDGLPVVDGKIEVDHTVINLTESQAEEVEILHTLTLTSNQWRELSKIGPACPKRFYTLLPIDYDDCTCGKSDYAIMMPGNKAAILHSFIKERVFDDLTFLFTPPKVPLLGVSRWEQYFGDQTVTLQVDHKGKFYLSATEIPYDKLREQLSKSEPPTLTLDQTQPIMTERTIVLELPPGVRASKDLKKKAQELKLAAEATGWNVELNPSNQWKDDSGKPRQ